MYINLASKSLLLKIYRMVETGVDKHKYLDWLALLPLQSHHICVYKLEV